MILRSASAPLFFLPLLLAGCGLPPDGGAAGPGEGEQGQPIAEEPPRCLRMRDEVRDGEGGVQWRTVYEYGDDKKLRISETDHEGDGSVESRSSYLYNGRGQLETIEHRDGDGELQAITRVQYDERGYPSVQEVRRPDEELMSRTETRFDVEGRLLERRRDDNGDGEWDYRRSQSWNDAGQKVRAEVEFADSGTVHVLEYHYDEDGLLRRHDEFIEGELRSVTTYLHDERGNKVEQAMWDLRDELLYRATYNYDEHDNKTGADYDDDGDDQIDRSHRYDWVCDELA